MGEVPRDLRYTAEHEWVRDEGGEFTIGITDFAQNSLTEVVGVELPEVGSEVELMESFASVESVKSVKSVESEARLHRFHSFHRFHGPGIC